MNLFSVMALLLLATTEARPVTLAVSIGTAPCNCGTTLMALASGGTTPYTFLWSNSQTTPVLNCVSSGTYTVTVTDAVNATATASITVVSPPVATIFSTGDCCCSALAGNPCTLVADGSGTGPFLYMWSNGATTKTITQLSCPGTYTVTVMNSTGCSSTASISLPSANCCHLNCPGDTAICYNVPDSLVKLTKPSYSGGGGTSGGPGCAYDSVWTPFAGPFNVGPNNVWWYVSLNGTVLDSCLQVVTRNTQINMFIGFTTDHPLTDSCIHICLKEQVYFQAVPPSFGFSQLQWNFGDGNYSNVPNVTHQFNFPGTFTVYLTGIDNCGNVKMDSTKVCVEASEGPDIQCPSVVCAGDTATYSTSVTGACTYLWTVTGGVISGPNNLATVTVVWGSGPTGTIKLLVTCSPALPCSQPTIRTITIVPSTMPITGETIVCAGTSSDYEVECIPGNIHTWTINPATAGTIDTMDHHIIVHWNPAFTGTVTVCVNYQNVLTGSGCMIDGCTSNAGCNGSACKVVHVRPVFGIAGPKKLCPNMTGLPFTAINVTTGAPEPNASWIVVTPAPSTLTFSTTALLNAYTWNAGIGIYSITAIAPPNIYCNDTAYTTVEVVEIKIPNPITGTDTVCPNSTHIYSVLPNMTGVNYIWTAVNGTPAGPTTTISSSISITWGPTGPYVIKVKQQLIASPFCESVEIQKNVYPYPPITSYPVISGTNPVCQGDTGIYSFTTLPPLPYNASYSWSVSPTTAGKVITNGVNPVMIEWLQPGPATVNLKISYCTDTTLKYNVTVNPIPPAPVIAGADTACAGDPAFFSTTSPGSILWNFGDPASGGANTSTLASTSHAFTAAGVYTVTLTVTNSFGCSNSSIIKVTVQDKPAVPVIQANPPGNPCIQTFGNYSFNTITYPLSPGALYTWSLSPGSFGILTQNSASSATVLWTAAGTDTVKLHIQSMCLDTTVKMVVTVQPNPSPVITGPFSACAGSTVTFTNNGPFATEVWNFGAGPTVNPTTTYNTPGTYTVTLTVSNGGCSATTTSLITINPLPTAFITTPDPLLVCNLPTNITLVAVNSGGYSFTWLENNIGILPTTPTINWTVTAPVPKTYSVIVRNAFGCTKLSNTITFDSAGCGGVVPPTPCGADTIGFSWTPPMCLTVTYTPLLAAGVSVTGWDFGDGATLSTTSSSSQTHTYALPGVYKVKIDGFSIPCNSPVSKMHPVTVPFDPDFDVTFQCSGNIMRTVFINKSLFLNFAGGYNWFWSDNLGQFNVADQSNPFPPQQTLTPGTHTITFSVNDPVTLATCTISKVITVPAPIVAGFTPLVACNNTATQFFDASTLSSNSAGWVWTFPGPVTANAQNPFFTFTSTGSQPVSLTVTDKYGCSSSITQNVNVFPQAVSVITGNPANFIGCSVILTASANATYNWSITPSPQTNQSYTVTQSGYYTVSGVDGNGCPYKAGPVHVIIKTAPVATISGKTIYCPGENINLTTTSGTGYSYAWTQTPSGGGVGGNSPNLNIPAPAPGIYVYQVTVTGSNGCTATASYTVTVDPPPSSLVISPAGPLTVCANAVPVLLSAPTGTGYTYFWSKTPPPPVSGSSSTFNATATGQYSVILTTANNCPYNLGPVSITVCPMPPANITGDTVLCENETLILQTIPGTGLTYQWYYGSTSNPIPAATSATLNIPNMLISNAGLYLVVVTNSCGCSTTDSVTVVVNPNPVPPVIQAFTGPFPGSNPAGGPLCDGQLYTLKVINPLANPTLTGTDYLWNNMLNGLVIPATLPGPYNVTATNQYGCKATSNTITINPTPDLTCVPSGCYEFCNECDSVTLPGPPGLASYNWEIKSGTNFIFYSSTQNLTVYVPGGTFRLIGFNSFGCSDTSDLLVISFKDCCQDSVDCIVDSCDHFNEIPGTLAGFQPFAPSYTNISYALSNAGSMGGTFDKYIRVTDLPDSSALETGPQFHGKWCCGKFCYDFKIFNDSVTGSPNFFPQFKIYSGTKGFLFTSNIAVNETSPWRRIIACVGMDTLPVNPLYGTWTPLPGTVVSDWPLVAANITNVVFVTAVSGDHGEVVGIDNVCFYADKLTLSCFGTYGCTPNSGTAFVFVSDTAGCSNFKYHWSNGATTQTVTGLPPGTYSVKVTNCCGCSDSCTLVIHEDVIIVTDTVHHINCDSIYGHIDIHVQNGNPPFTYLWSNGEITEDLVVIQHGTYTVTVTDGGGCSVTHSATVLVQGSCNCNNVPPPPPPTMTITGITADSCNGHGCIHVSFTGCCLRFAYTYFNPCIPGLSYSIAPTTDSTVLCNLQAGIYTVYVSDPCGNVIQQTVTVPLGAPPLAATVQYGTCGAGVCVNTTGGCPPYSYLWSNGGTTSCLTGYTPCNSYIVTVTDSRGCTVVKTVTGPSISIENVKQPTCCLENGRLCLNVCLGEGPYTYLWNNGKTTQCLVNIGAGVYCVTVTNSTGNTASCCFTLTNAPVPPPLVTFTYSSCGTTVKANIESPCSNYTAHWENGSTGLVRNNLNGCDSVTLTVVMCDGTVYHHGFKIPLLSATITPILCAGGTGTICINVECLRCPPYSYSWTNGGNCSATNGNCITCVMGSYEVCITNGCGDVVCCKVSLPGVSPVTPVVTSTVSPTSIAPSSGAINISVTGGTPSYTYLWSNGSSSQNLTGVAAGTYTVTVTDANGCTATLSKTLVIRCLLTYSNAVLQNASCQMNNGVALVMPGGGTAPYTFLWQTIPVQTTATGTGLPYGGVVNVIITDANGCSVTDPVSVPSSSGLVLTLTPSVYVGGKNIRCNGGNDGSVTVSVSGGTGPFTYNWSNGATTSVITGLTAGTYTVTVSNGACTATALIILKQPPAISVNIVKTNVTCSGGHNGTATATASGGTSPYTFQWNTSPVITTSSATGLGAGVYTVTVSDANGCTKTALVTITQPNPLIINCTALDAKCFGASNGSVTTATSGGTPPYTFLWSTGHTTQNRPNAAAGTYTVTVTDSKGCTAQCTAVVSQPALITAAIAKTNVSCFGGHNGTAVITAAGGTPPYTYSWNTVPVQTNLTATGLGAGTFNCVVTDSKGCAKSFSVTITQPTALSLAISKTNVSVPGGSNGSATANPAGGTPPYSYLWNTSPAKTTQTAGGLTAGTYTVTVTDSKGCTKSGSVTITQPAPRPSAGETHDEFSLHPNPASLGIYVKSDLRQGERIEMAITDVSGRLVQKVADRYFDAGPQETYISTAGFEEGLYFLTIRKADRLEVIRFSVIKED